MLEKIGVKSDTPLGRILTATIAHWPEHAQFIIKTFTSLPGDVKLHSQIIAELVEKIGGNDLGRLIRGYQWMVGMLMDEERYFRRTGTYRNSSFDHVNKTVYQKRDVMSLYLDGLLLSYVLWPNHLLSISFYLKEFLGKATVGGRHLEIGPGHGLLLTLAVQRAQPRDVQAIDISPTSLDQTRRCLETLGCVDKVTLKIQDILTNDHDIEEFDSIVISEVIEHLEDPENVLQQLRRRLRPGGRIFINVPINSPAIDHIYLLQTPEEVLELIGRAGLQGCGFCFAPAAGYTLEHALKQRSTISCVIIASAL